MSSKLLKLTIAKVDAPVFDDDVIFVTLPGISGEMTILAHHTALISPLKSGTITIKKKDGNLQTITIEQGTLEMSQNHATILI